MKSKKGAIELSITTIIVIVIGVTLLILGLGFVRSIFGNISKISDTTFAKAQSFLEEGLEEVSSPITISPSQITIEQKGDDGAKLILANLDEEDISLSIKIIPSKSDKNIDCYIYNKEGETTKNDGPYLISSGNQEKIVLIAKDKGGAIRSTACVILIEGLPAGQDNKETLLIKVRQKEGLF